VVAVADLTRRALQATEQRTAASIAYHAAVVRASNAALAFRMARSRVANLVAAAHLVHRALGAVERKAAPIANHAAVLGVTLHAGDPRRAIFRCTKPWNAGATTRLAGGTPAAIKRASQAVVDQSAVRMIHRVAGDRHALFRCADIGPTDTTSLSRDPTIPTIQHTTATIPDRSAVLPSLRRAGKWRAAKRFAGSTVREPTLGRNVNRRQVHVHVRTQRGVRGYVLG
jgi:hypothetical protein